MAISFVSKMSYTIVFAELLSLRAEVAYPLAIVIGSVQNFFVLMHWVYKTAGHSELHQFVKFVQSIAGFQLAEYLMFLGLLNGLHMPYKPAMVITMGTLAITKSVVYKAVVFRHKKPTQEEIAAAEVFPEEDESIDEAA